MSVISNNKQVIRSAFFAAEQYNTKSLFLLSSTTTVPIIPLGNESFLFFDYAEQVALRYAMSYGFVEQKSAKVRRAPVWMENSVKCAKSNLHLDDPSPSWDPRRPSWYPVWI